MERELKLAHGMYVRAYKNDDGQVWFSLMFQGGHVYASLAPETALELASMLANAAGVDDPVPVGEATESDFSALEAA